MTEVNGIAEDWQLVKLGSLVEKVGSGITPKGGQESYLNQGVLFIRSQNVLAGKLKLNDVAFISKEQHEKMQGSKLISGDVLLNITGASIGRSSVVPESLLEGNVNQHVCIIRTKSILNNIFLCHFLNSSYGQNQIGKFQAGGNREGLNFQQIRSFHIPYPSLIEQQRIAEILTTVDEKIEVIETQITQTQELKKGLMQQLLTKGIGHTKFKDSPLGEIPESWEVVKLGDVVNKIIGGGTPSRENLNFWGKEIPWATVKDLRKTRLDDTQEYITKVGLENSSANIIPMNTLIIATRMALGKAVFFSVDVAINQDLKAIFPNQKLDNFFLLHWFQYNSDKIMSMGSGSTVKGIRLEVLKAFDFLLPLISEQKKIASILNEVDAKLNVLSEKKDTFQAMKKGLMQQLLTGKIRVKINQHV